MNKKTIFKWPLYSFFYEIRIRVDIEKNMMSGKQYPSKFKDEAISCEGYCEQSMLKDGVFNNLMDRFARYGHNFLWFHKVLF